MFHVVHASVIKKLELEFDIFESYIILIINNQLSKTIGKKKKKNINS